MLLAASDEPQEQTWGTGEQPQEPSSAHLRRSVVDGGATRGGAEQELPARGGGGAPGDHGHSGAAGAAARPCPELPALALAAHGLCPGSGITPELDGACLLLRDSRSLCPSGSRCPGGCPAQIGGPGPALVVLALTGELRCHRFTLLCWGRAVPCWEPWPGPGWGARSLPPAKADGFATKFCTRFIQLFI